METNATYKFRNHLGSASWITDHSGRPVQHLQYLPYGEPYINQRLSNYSERFTFTGKERDEETGYGYFGARYMDHELTTMWLSIDPMSDKYPSLSPYAYCTWNPVKLVDPDGRDWYRYTETKDGNTSYHYYWKEGHAKSIEVNGHTFDNVGAYASIRQNDGKYNNYYQQACIGRSENRQSSRDLSHFLHSRDGRGARARLLGKGSPLSVQSKTELFQSQVASSQQFYEDACDITANSLTKVGTGVTAIGLGISTVAPEVGVPVMAIGNNMTNVGGSLTAARCLLSGDTKGAVINGGAVVMGMSMSTIKAHPALTQKQQQCLDGAWNLFWDINPAGKRILQSSKH